jgi:hypothetical protein
MEEVTHINSLYAECGSQWSTVADRTLRDQLKATSATTTNAAAYFGSGQLRFLAASTCFHLVGHFYTLLSPGLCLFLRVILHLQVQLRSHRVHRVAAAVRVMTSSYPIHVHKVDLLRRTQDLVIDSEFPVRNVEITADWVVDAVRGFCLVYKISVCSGAWAEESLHSLCDGVD